MFPFKIGDSIIINLDIEGLFYQFSSVVVDMEGNTFTLVRPTVNELPAPLSKLIDIIFSRESGRFGASCGVISSTDELIVLQIPLRSEISEIQTRIHFRVNLNAYAKYIRLNHLYKPVKNSLLSSGKLVDISGGGCMLQTKQVLTIGDLIQVRFDLKDTGFLEIPARVLRFAGESVDGFKFGNQFERIREGIRERIVKYVFVKQRELRRNNLKK